MASIEVQVPDIGDFDEVTVIELLVKVGDTVKAEQSLITVESDKASMEIPSSHAGVVKAISVKLGDKVKQGSVLLQLEAAGATPVAVAPVPAPAPAAVAAPATTAQVKPAVASAANAQAATTSVASLIEVKIPDIGDFKDVSVIELLVKVGDTIKVEQSLITVESDKASMEIPSSNAGVVKELRVKLGDVVNIGAVVVIVEAVGATPAAAAPAQPVSVPNTAVAQVNSAQAATTFVATSTSNNAPAATPAHNPTALTTGLPHASPSVRKFARELGVPLNEVKGSGLKGRITEADVQGFTKSVM